MALDFELIENEVVGKLESENVIFKDYINSKPELEKIESSLGELHFKLQEVFLKELDADNVEGYDLALKAMYAIEDNYPESILFQESKTWH